MDMFFFNVFLLLDFYIGLFFMDVLNGVCLFVRLYVFA